MFYTHRSRQRDPELRPARAKHDDALRVEIKRVWTENLGGVHGAKKVWRQLVREGTTFRIYFPRCHGIPVRRIASAAPKAELGRSETVLVVEDQRAVRELAARALRARGYHVLEAENRDAAVALIRERGDSIALLLTDVVMPRMSGTELAKRFRESCRDAKVLQMSGYTDEEANRHGVLESGHALLQKPFMPNTLAIRVREILDGADAS